MSTAREAAERSRAAASRRARRSRRLVWRVWATLPAFLLVLTGLVGLVVTQRSAPPPPTVRQPVRYLPGPPIASRAVIVFAPQLDQEGTALLSARLQPPAASGQALLTVSRPSLTSFEEISLLFLAGNMPTRTAPALPASQANQPPDTLLRGLQTQGRQVALVGPDEWRALFSAGKVLSANATPTITKPEPYLTEATAALRAPENDLIALYLRFLTTRDLRNEPESLHDDLVALNAQLLESDLVVIASGGGAIGEPLHLTVSGKGVQPGRPRAVGINDLAPTCAVLIGAPYPFESRGRVVWPVLLLDPHQKAAAAAALARQRMALTTSAVPFGVSYPPELSNSVVQLEQIDMALDNGEFDYAYQLATSSLAQADRLIGIVSRLTPLPRRAAWAVVIGCGVILLYILLLAALTRSWEHLAIGLFGLVMALGGWALIIAMLQRAIVPTVATGLVTVALAALPGAVVSTLLSYGLTLVSRRLRLKAHLALDFLVLLSVLPAAFCAYRYGLPWRLRFDETVPLFRWRSVLLAPAALFITGYGCALLLTRWRALSRARRPAGAPDASSSNSPSA